MHGWYYLAGSLSGVRMFVTLYVDRYYHCTLDGHS